MSALVPAEDIERIVGAARHAVNHLGRAVSAEQTVYVLHSRQCLDSGRDLRFCDYSLALDRGIDTRDWVTALGDPLTDRPVLIAIHRSGRLVPIRAWEPIAEEVPNV